MKKLTWIFIIVIVLIVAAFALKPMLDISPKASVVNHRQYLGEHTNDTDIYATSSEGVYFPLINLSIAPMAELMLVDISDDPEYTCIELQTFNDSRGIGARVLLYHHSGPADSYYTDEAFVMHQTDRNAYTINPDIHWKLEKTKYGLDAALNMRDSHNRLIEFTIKEHHQHPESEGFLAPIGGSDAITFNTFPLFFMKGMVFIPQKGTKIDVKIDNQIRSVKKLPLPVNGQKVYLARYTDEPVMGCWNSPFNGQLIGLNPNRKDRHLNQQLRYELVDNSGHIEIKRTTGINENHELGVEFSPPIPDLISLKNDLEVKGRFSTIVDGLTGIVAGEYSVHRDNDIVTFTIQPLKGWQPLFGSSWVKGWTWQGVITIKGNKQISMEAKWL